MCSWANYVDLIDQARTFGVHIGELEFYEDITSKVVVTYKTLHSSSFLSAPSSPLPSSVPRAAPPEAGAARDRAGGIATPIARDPPCKDCIVGPGPYVAASGRSGRSRPGTRVGGERVAPGRWKKVRSRALKADWASSIICCCARIPSSELRSRPGGTYSICIIQDSEEDWRAESSLMDKVYRFCQCCIAATAAKDR